tara:strand:- start:172 stop:372 length:201 start_codon:yes stop_codon:yes gene_type:complete
MLNPQRAEYEFYVYSTVSGVADIRPKNNRKLIKITDVLGRTSKAEEGIPLFYLYDDGTVDKKLILD